MRLYRKIIPKIAKDVIRTLSCKELIEIENNQIEEAELDIAAIMVEYQNAEDRVSVEAKEVLSRRGMGFERYAQVKKSVADVRGLKIGADGIDYILEQILEGLFASKNIEEIFAEDHEIKKIAREIMDKYMSVSEDLDYTVRRRLKNIREGTPEWEIEYSRMVSQLRRQKGLI